MRWITPIVLHATFLGIASRSTAAFITPSRTHSPKRITAHRRPTKQPSCSFNPHNANQLVLNSAPEECYMELPPQELRDAQPFVEGGGFFVMEMTFLATIAYAAASSLPVLNLIDGDFSGLQLNEQTGALLALFALHALMIPASVALCRLKEIEGSAVAGLRTLLFGALEVYRVGLLEDKEEQEARRIRTLPPLSMSLDSNTLLNSKASPAGLLLTASITASEGFEHKVRTLLEDLAADTTSQYGKLVSSVHVDQDGEDRTNFLLLQRFPTVDAMRRYQNSLVFKVWSERMRPLLKDPMGLYLTNERNGKLESPVHPFGPGGEGGREDAIYSSPTNLQGSGT